MALGWNLNRELSKINYKIHTEAIKENLIPPELTQIQKTMTYASEADLLNVALFGTTAKEWRERNSQKKGNIRDYATLNQLLVLANIESYNAVLIEQKIDQSYRLEKLRELAVKQLKAIEKIDLSSIKLLDKSNE